MELERKKREMYRDIERLKKELVLVKNPNERKLLMDRLADIWVGICMLVTTVQTDPRRHV